MTNAGTRAKAAVDLPGFVAGLDRDGKQPAYAQIVERIEAAIQSGALRENDLLPPMRTVAAELGVNQMTVSKSYRILSERGLVSGKSGGGTRVLTRPKAASGHRSEELGDLAMSPFSARMGDFATAPGVIALTDAFPAFSREERSQFRLCLDEAMERGGDDLFSYGSASGLPALRQLLAQMVVRQGIGVTPERIIVTAGAQQAIYIAAHVLLTRGDTVLVEMPTYFGALDVFRSQGINIVGLPMGEDGVSIEDLREACRTHRPRAFYTIPNAHNPTGVTTSSGKRHDILDVLRGSRCALIEDDYSPELAFESDVPASYAGMAGIADEVYYVRSLGKIYLPGIRLGFLIPPEPRFATALALKQAMDLHTPHLLQCAAELFLRRRSVDRRLRSDVVTIAARAGWLFEELESRLPAGCTLRMASGGLSLWLGLPRPLPNAVLYRNAVASGVAFALGSAFQPEGGEFSEGIRLSFGQLENGDVVAAAERIAQVLLASLGGEPDPGGAVPH